MIASAGNYAINRDFDADLVLLPGDLPHVIEVSAAGPVAWLSDPDTNLDLPAPTRTTASRPSTWRPPAARRLSRIPREPSGLSSSARTRPTGPSTWCSPRITMAAGPGSVALASPHRTWPASPR